MHDPLNRLYRTKIAFLAVVLIVAGLALISFSHWAGRTPAWHWLDSWPLSDVGIGIFTTGLLGVGLQYFVDEDKELHDTDRLKRVLADSAPAMRDAVISGFAFEPNDLARVATPEVLDQIAENSLAIRLGDASFAAELYDDLKRQAIDMPERLHNLRISLRLSPMPAARKGDRPSTDLFVVTARWECTVVPIYATRRFVCISDINEFRELNHDSATSAWFFTPKTNLTADDPKAFELVEFTVDGQSTPIRRSAKKASQTYTVSIGKEAVDAARPVNMVYTYRTVTAADGHRLRLRVDQPTRGLTVELDYSQTDIEHVAVLDYIASSVAPHFTTTPRDLPEKRASIEFPGWALPRSGVAFTW